MSTIAKKMTETIMVAGALLGPSTIAASVLAHDELKSAPFKTPLCTPGKSLPPEAERKEKAGGKDDPCLYGRVGGFGG
ncbi:hypothetical protein BDV97DRAFT_400383 [Delphinella strobiligena]|nr:hypothetical protein BDV97DRAFT_400383 [Delphinella strobiligena]